MYKVIYDFDNGYEVTRGISEDCEDWQEAQELVQALREDEDYSNIQIIQVGE